MGVPFASSIGGHTISCVLNMVAANPRLFQFAFVQGASIPDNRNTIVEYALTQGTSYLFFLDADLLFKPEAIHQLLAADKDIVGGIYNMKSLPPKTTLILRDENGKLHHPEKWLAGLHKAAAIPVGFSLIKMDVFKKIDPPWFGYNFQEFGYEYTEGRRMSEDTYFCLKATKYGYDIWYDSEIVLGHVGNYTY